MLDCGVGADPSTVQTDEPVRYNQVPGTEDYYDKETFHSVMGQFDKNWNENAGDELYSGGLEAVGRMMMNGLGNLTARMEQIDRRTRMQQYGMDEAAIEGVLQIPGLESLAGLEPEQIAEVMHTFENISNSRGRPGPSDPQGGPPPGGAPRAVRRDPTHFREPTRATGSGKISPDQELEAEIASHGGGSKKARALGAQMFLARAKKVRGVGG